jgi:hypothetical protein
MEQSPSWEANWFATSQEIPRVLWNPKVPHRTHKRPPPMPNLSQPNPFLTPTCDFLKIHPNIISHLRLPSRLFPSGFPTRTLYTPLPSAVWIQTILIIHTNYYTARPYSLDPFGVLDYHFKICFSLFLSNSTSFLCHLIIIKKNSPVVWKTV